MRSFLAVLLSVFVLDVEGQLPSTPRYCLSIQIGNSHGSGFFYNHSNDLYVVTAKHVLFDDKNTNYHTTNAVLHGDALKATFIYPVSGTNLISLKVDASVARKMGNVFFSTNKDVAAIKWGYMATNKNIFTLRYSQIDSPTTSSTGTNRNNLGIVHGNYTQTFDTVEPAIDVYLIGFPTDIGVTDTQIQRTQPLFAKGIVAGKNYLTRRIIIDIPTYGGNSGGPVWGRKEEGLAKTTFFVLGFVVEYIPGGRKLGNGKFAVQNSGYAVVEPIDSVVEILPRN